MVNGFDRPYSGRRSRLLLIFVVATALLLLVGAVLWRVNSEKRKDIESQIESLTSQRDGLSQTLDSEREHLGELTRILDNQNAEMEVYKASVERELAEHSMVTIAIVAGKVGADTLNDKDNVFTRETQTVAGITVVAATAYALFHPQEVIDVVTLLNEADAKVHSRQTAIAGTSSAIRQLKIHIEASQIHLDQLNQQIEALRNEFGK